MKKDVFKDVKLSRAAKEVYMKIICLTAIENLC
jgi:hypothetical protein